MTSSLKAHQLLQKIVASPITTASFPTHFSVVLRLKQAMNNDDTPIKKIAEILEGEPVVSGRVIQTANAAAFTAHGNVMSLEKAVNRLGIATVRRIALGVAMQQLSKSKEMLVFASLTRKLWLNAMYIASASYVIADKLTTFNKDEMLFMGLMVNMGGFYLLYQASQHAELRQSEEDIHEAIRNHYRSLTSKVLKHLNLSESFCDEIDFKTLDGTRLETVPKSQKELIYAANILASKHYPWDRFHEDFDCLGKMYYDLEDEITKRLRALQSDFR